MGEFEDGNAVDLSCSCNCGVIILFREETYPDRRSQKSRWKGVVRTISRQIRRLEGSSSQSAVQADIAKDAVMIMVDIYQTLPHLKYQGKYPSHIASPADTGKNTPQPNGNPDPKNTHPEPSASPVPPCPPPAEKEISSVESTSRKNGDIIQSVLRQETPVSSDRKRGRSMERRNSPLIIDSYRPRQRENSRSQSRGRVGPPRKSGIDRYSRERNRRDNYVPAPQRPRKGSVDGDVENSRGREKRRRDEENGDWEISEGEIR